MTKGANAATKAVHPKSRKALDMKKQGIHDFKKKEQKQIRDTKIVPTFKRYLYIHEQIFGADIRVKKTCCTDEEMIELIDRFLEHADKEFDKKHPKLTPNLRLQKESVRALYTSGVGLQMPDLCNPEVFSKFRVWNKEKESVIGLPSKIYKKKSENEMK